MKLYLLAYAYNNAYPSKRQIMPYSFASNTRFYRTDRGREIGTNSWLFRDDIDWKKLAAFEKEHFKNKDRVNIVQFACSDGSESYTKLITLFEDGKQSSQKFLPIAAYDIDYEIIKAAKSGYINLTERDFFRAKINSCQAEKYFKKTNYQLNIPNEAMGIMLAASNNYISPKAYKVVDELTSNVKFEQADMYDILENLDDDSNTILICRNILGYFPSYEIKDFIGLVSQKLKKDSILIIGKLDTENTGIYNYLKTNNFEEIMPLVYRKTK